MPGDKSISHRAVILGSLAAGKTTIRGLLEANDVLSTISAFQAMGVSIAGAQVETARSSGWGCEAFEFPDRISILVIRVHRCGCCVVCSLAKHFILR